MSGELERIEQGAALAIGEIRAAINAASDAAEAFDLNSRVKMARAWAKSYGRVRELRLDLLVLEIDSLVRVWELGGADMLSGPERKAAEYLASLSPGDRAECVAASGASTTAVGMCRSIWSRESEEQLRRMGRSWVPSPASEDHSEGRDISPQIVAEAMHQLLDDYGDAGEAFTVEQMTDAVCIDYGDAGPFVEGVREMCRHAIRSAADEIVSGFGLPRFVTAYTPDGDYARIPTLRARMSHLRQHIGVRREQASRLAGKVAELEGSYSRLEAAWSGGGDPLIEDGGDAA